jgi:hypothetical protein
VLYLLCVISTIVPINFLVKSEESTLLLPRADNTRDNINPEDGNCSDAEMLEKWILVNTVTDY